MKFEFSTEINTSADKVFALYADVAQWNKWDPDVKSSSISGPFVSGARGIVTPHGGPKSELVFSAVIPNKSFTATCKLPLCVMQFDHQLVSKGASTIATHQVTFSGLLAPLFGRLIGSGMKKTLPKALEGLKRAAQDS
jgi:Polyketide cyclase / dehydrase and lipid transport